MSQGSFYSAVQILVLYVSIFHSIDLQVQSQLSWFIDVYICCLMLGSFPCQLQLLEKDLLEKSYIKEKPFYNHMQNWKR